MRELAHDGTAPVEPAEVAIAAIDETTFLDPAFASRPRAVWTPELARVQNALLDAGAKVVAWDLILPTSAASWTHDISMDRPLLLGLRRAAQENRVILGEAAFRGRRISPFAGYAFAAGGAANIRLVNALADRDGVVRSVPLMTFDSSGGEMAVVPSLALEAALRAGAAAPDWSASDNKAIVNFDPARPIPAYSFADLNACAEKGEAGYFENAFRDKVVLIGLVLNLEDRKISSDRWMTRESLVTPARCALAAAGPAEGRGVFGTPGPLILATAIDNLISGRVFHPPPQALWVLLLAVPSLVTAGLAMFSRLSVALAGAGLMIALAPAAGLLFLERLWIAPMIEGASAAAFSLASGLVLRVLFSDRREAMLRRAFSAYLDDRMMQKLLEDEEPPHLGGETRDMTSLFVDIAGFSGIAERLDSTDLVAFLNRFFETIQREVRARGGMIERFAGDAVIAIYGAPLRDPDHAGNAVRTAIAARGALAQLKDPWGAPLEARFGVNTGPATVGNIGAEGRLSYTAIGDAVNLASRLEGANKAFGTRVLCGAATKEATAGVVWRRIGRVQVVGRGESAQVYQPLGLAGETPPAQEAAAAAYHAALDLAEAGDLPGAHRAAEADILADDGPARALKAELRRRIDAGESGPFAFRLAAK